MQTYINNEKIKSLSKQKEEPNGNSSTEKYNNQN
jgi:hypothetical protein